MALTFSIFAIASFPEVERRVLEEVDAFWYGASSLTSTAVVVVCLPRRQGLANVARRALTPLEESVSQKSDPNSSIYLLLF